MEAIPIFEAKNKLPLFIHQAEESGPVFISRRNKNVAVILSIDAFNKLNADAKKPPIWERAKKLREQYAPDLTNEEIDKIFDVRESSTTGTSWESDVFKGVFDN